jgi:hypothetical protein
MKAKNVALSFVVVASSSLWGCAQIVGISDLDGGPDANATTGSGSGSGGGSGGGSSSGGSSSGGGCTVPTGEACGVDPQCGCAKGQKCDFGGGNPAACVAAGAGIVGTRCTANTECAAGLTCLGGVCHSYCASLGTSCPGGVCLQGESSATQDLVCTIACTLAPDSCAGANACLPIVVANTIVSDCEAPGTVPRGGSCTANSDCAAGLGCDGTAASSACLQWCQISPAPSACAGGGTCTSFNTPVTVNGITYGDCQ